MIRDDLNSMKTEDMFGGSNETVFGEPSISQDIKHPGPTQTHRFIFLGLLFIKFGEMTRVAC